MDLNAEKIFSQVKASENVPDWLFWVSISLVLFFTFISFWVLWKKSKAYSIITSLLLGLSGMIILMLLSNNYASNSRVISNLVLGFPGILFIWSISIFIPIYIFFILFNFVLIKKNKKIKLRSYIASFGSLFGLSLLGVIVALLLIPLIIYVIPSYWFGGSGNNQIHDTENWGWIEKIDGVLSYFTKWWIIQISIWSSLIIGIGIKLIVRNKKIFNKIYEFSSKILYLINYYFKIIIKAAPIIIITRLMTLGLIELDATTNAFKFMMMYLSLFSLGSIVIFIILFILNLSLSTKNNSLKDNSKILTNHVLYVFAAQSEQVSLPITQANVKKLGASEEISKLTPVKGTIIGRVMCNGFSPMLALLFIIANENNGQIPVNQLFLAISSLLIMVVSTSGQGSSDYTIILSAISTLGFGKDTYTSLIMPIQEINERTITRPNNSLGLVLATLITEKVHARLKKKAKEKKKSKLDSKNNKINSTEKANKNLKKKTNKK